jgi:NAD(P)-dependent dehydrogenase (short-subunit alcohol dehydrogenase family)
MTCGLTSPAEYLQPSSKELRVPTIAIVGAGPGLGLSIAKLFGDHGFTVALIARSKDHRDTQVAQLAELGTTAAAFPADVSDRPALTAALERAMVQFGAIEVLAYSPYSGLSMVRAPEVTVDSLEPQMEHHLYGAVTATQTVLPAMLKAGGGTLLFTTGGGAISPSPQRAPMNAAQAALRNWVLNLNGALAETGVYAGNVAISVFIGTSAPPGVPYAAPDEIAEGYWDLHTHRSQPERLIIA